MLYRSPAVHGYKIRLIDYENGQFSIPASSFGDPES